MLSKCGQLSDLDAISFIYARKQMVSTQMEQVEADRLVCPWSACHTYDRLILKDPVPHGAIT